MSSTRQLRRGFLSRIFNPPPSGAAVCAVPGGLTLFHVTHWKAASQWFKTVLEDLFGSAVLPGEYGDARLFSRPALGGAIYTCVSVTKQEFGAIDLPHDARRFVLIRDLRDTLVSAYFSLKHSHPVETPELAKIRVVLTKLEKEEGLLYLLETWLGKSAVIHRSWLEAGERCFRLEDFMRTPAESLNDVFQSRWGVAVNPSRVEEVVSRRSFESFSAGRPVGQEDVRSHYRKGVAGDWRLHFTPKLTSRFKQLYNDVVIGAGYERDGAW